MNLPRCAFLLLLGVLVFLAVVEAFWLATHLPAGDRLSMEALVVSLPLLVLLACWLLVERRRLAYLHAEQRQLTETLLREQHLWNTLMDNAPDRVYFKDAQGRFLWINPTLARRFGLNDPDQVAGQTDAAFYAAEFVQRAQAEERQVMETGQPLLAVEGQVHWADGAVTWAVTTTLPFRDPQGQIIGIVGFSRDVTERKRNEEALRQAEAKYRGIFENAVEGIYQTTLDGRFLTANPMLARMYGFASSEELLAAFATPEEHFYAEPGRRAEFIRLIRERGSLSGFESLVRRRDGSLIWVSENARMLLTEDGTPVGFEGMVVEITERKRAEETLHKANDALRAIIQASPLAIFTIDLQGLIQTWNAAAERIFGWTEAEVLRLPTPLVPADKRSEYQELLERLRGGQTFAGVQALRQRKDGSLIDVSLSAAPLYDAHGEVNGITVVAADITDIKRTEQALIQERALLRGLIDSIPDLIFYKNNSGTYVGCNAAFEKYVGKRAEEIIGATTIAAFPPGRHEHYQEQDQKVLTTGQPLRQEEWIEYPDGRRALVEVVKTLFFGPDGRVLGLIGIGRDITERTRLEEQLRLAQKMEAVGQLAGGVAHDFNTRLTAILGNVSLLIAAAAEDDPNRDVLRETEQAAARAADLTRQLLGYSRQTLLQLEPTDLTTAVDETVGILRRTIDPRIVVEVRNPARLWSVQADRGQLNQVVLNLCINARDAMPDGGRLHLETANVTLDAGQARRHLDARAGEFVRLRVRDTGHGIPPEIRARIFDPFFTTKGPGKGTGLGLAMVFGIIKQHQGWIECHSEVSKGTDFDIYLPRFGDALAKAPAPVPEKTPDGGSETILLVDDEAVIRNLGKTILQRYGYKVLLAEDGLAALEVYENHRGTIDLVILDLTMPRLSGRDALRRLLQIDPNVRVVYSSGYSAEQLAEDGRQGVLGFVNKPYRPQDLAAAVRRVLDQARNAVC
ncbi:MAG: PAS domain S-box protein [Planctomycetia bacterium]|nr:PAS domain S-box protein [Planctomycetia bacterium]